MTAILLLVGIAAHGVGFVPNPVDLAKTLLLIPGDHDLVLGVAWTLVREMVFYVLFGLAIVDRRLAVAGVAACLAASWIPVLRFWALGWFDLLFVIGIGAAWTTLHLPAWRPRLLAALGVALFLMSGLAEDAGLLPMVGLEGRLAYGIASGIIILGLAQSERAGQFRVGPVLTLLGAASYSIYLVHSPMLGYTARVMVMVGLFPGVPDWCAMLVAVLSAVSAGIAFHLLVERPATRALQLRYRSPAMA